MIVSLNIPDDLIAFIDAKATDAKLSRSAWMTAFLRNSQTLDSHTGQQALQACLVRVMADGALRSGVPLDSVRQRFPDFERPCVPDQVASAPQLPAADTAPPAPHSVAVTRRKPYQRNGKPLPALMCPKDSRG